MSRPNNASILIAAIVHAGCAEPVAGLLADVALESGRRGESERQMAAAVLAESVRELQRRVSAGVSAQLATVRGD